MNTLESKMIVNPFDSASSDVPKPRSQKIEQVETLMDGSLMEMFEAYKKMSPLKGGSTFEDMVYKIEIKELNHLQIDWLLQVILRNSSQEAIEHSSTGLFLSRFIKQSFKHDRTDMMLSTKDSRISFLGNRLEGSAGDPLKLVIDGNTGANLGCKSAHCSYSIIGDVGLNCGYQSRGCAYDINGSAEDGIGQTSQLCKYNITGDVGKDCGYVSETNHYTIRGNAGASCGKLSNSCTYEIGGTVGQLCGFGASNCTFKSSNMDTFNRMLENVTKGNSNIVILTDKSGKIIRRILL